MFWVAPTATWWSRRQSQRSRQRMCRWRVGKAHHCRGQNCTYTSRCLNREPTFGDSRFSPQTANSFGSLTRFLKYNRNAEWIYKVSRRNGNVVLMRTTCGNGYFANDMLLLPCLIWKHYPVITIEIWVKRYVCIIDATFAVAHRIDIYFYGLMGTGAR